MIPRTRLILWTALVVLPFAVLAGASPATLLPSFAVMGAFLLLVISDAVFGGRATGIEIRLPTLVRWQKDRAAELELEINNAKAKAILLRVALVFPPSVQVEEEDRLVQLPEDVTVSRLPWAAWPTQRGAFHLRHVSLETASPLGFWAFRVTLKVACELRVYPNLQDERRHLAALFLRRGRVGVHAQRHTGTGREFEKLRDYSPGDNLGDIHWKASARRNALISKVYQVERTHEVYVAVDTSRLSARVLEKPGGTAMERYVSAALLLALAAEQQGDQFGLITFSDRVHSFVRARSGPAHLDGCRDRLYALQPHDVSPDYDELFTLLRLRLRKRALLILLTSLDDPVLSAHFVKAAQLSQRQHLLRVNMLQPPNVGPLFDPDSPVHNMDDLYRAVSGHLQWQKLRELQMTLQRQGVRLSFIRPEALAAEILAQHTEARARALV